MVHRPVVVFALGALGGALVVACSSDAGAAAARWTGSMDTLPSGQIVVHNDAQPIWQESTGWQVVEEVRLGSALGDGPEAFGRIEAFEVAPSGRIWVLDGHARRLIVFDASGVHLRTVGRQGGGPGEFMQPVDVDLAPDGHMWVVDIGNIRISAFDTAGAYVDARRIPVRFKITPWFGGFDDRGSFYAPVWAEPSETEAVAYTLVRHDSTFVPKDTLERPRDPTTREVFEYRGTIGRVPLQGTLQWRLSRQGTVWAILTDQYRIFELGWSGDTLRTITRAAPEVPVTDADLEVLRDAWRQEIAQRGALPSWWSKLPKTKPPVTGLFFQDEERNLWVERQPVEVADTTRVFDVFDREGRFLGSVQVPFVLRGRPIPIVRDGFLYGVTLDEWDAQYVVKARVIRDDER